MSGMHEHIDTNAWYTEGHEWVRKDPGDPSLLVMGITPHAAHALGDINFIEMPPTGEHLDTGDLLCVVESVKSASDIYIPLAGVVVEVNEVLAREPGLLNTDSYQAGWIARIRPDSPDSLAGLLSPLEYAELL